ncbi:MAG TPA: PEP-CTERM sorting domain-containing protein [Phycisphaerae bacterium]|nr:PEP-CTERM sorting domain-containing protein [Phycisphaerae bacterium]
MKGGIDNLRKTLGSVAMVLAMILLVGGTAYASPIAGVFRSEEFEGGDIMDGRWSAGLPEGDTGSFAQIGSIINAASWDGDQLGTQWQMSGQELVATHQLSVEPFGPFLTIEKWSYDYDGGTMLLKETARDGATSQWWGGDSDGSGRYEVAISDYAHTTQVTYLNGDVVGVYSIITLTGLFDQDLYPDYELRFMLAVAVQLGEGSEVPSNYPPFLFGDYPNPEEWGQWGIAQKIKMEITPEPSSLAVVTLGGLLVLMRRRRRRRA